MPRAAATAFSNPPQIMTSRAAREAKVKALWKQQQQLPLWAAALAAATARAAQPSAGPRLSAKPELDSFYYEELPKQLLLSSSLSSSASQGPLASLTPGQLALVVEWKLARGTWRPRLLDFAKVARAADVSAAAAAASRALLLSKSKSKGGGSGEEKRKNLGTAIDALCVLKGIGPATATALLSAADASVPFLSDEALVAVLGAREYTKPAALAVTEALRERAAALNALEEKEEEGREGPWTASKVERALWSASRAADVDEEEKEEGKEEKKEKKKRKVR